MNCKHEHVKPAGFPTGALICTNCKRIIDPVARQPLECAVAQMMKPNKLQAEMDKKLWD